MSLDPTKRVPVPNNGSGMFDVGAGIGEIVQNILNGIGTVLTGAVTVVGEVFQVVVDGVIGFIEGVARAIGGIFGGGGQADPPPPPEPIFNPIRTNLEAVLAPKFEQVDNLLMDSAGLGEESKTIQEQMRELINPENEDSTLWNLVADVQDLNDQRNDIQDQLIALNRGAIEAQSEFISRTMFVPGLQGAFDDYFSVTRSSSQWRVEALGDWTGEYTLQSAYNTSRGWEPVIDFGKIPNQTTTPRVRMHAGAEYSTIINYWVRQGVHHIDDKTAPSYSTALGTWSAPADLTFTAAVTALHDLYYRVTWAAATYDDVYSFRIRRNGVTLYQWGPFVKVGPMFSFQSGVRTRTISEFGVPLTAGDVVTFETFSDASTTSQRAVSSSERKISWTSSS